MAAAAAVAVPARQAQYSGVQAPPAQPPLQLAAARSPLVAVSQHAPLPPPLDAAFLLLVVLAAVHHHHHRPYRRCD